MSPAFFVAGVSEPLGPVAPWLILLMCAVAAFVRADRHRKLGTLRSRRAHWKARLAFGATGGRIAAASTLSERLLLAAVGCGVAAHYGASLVVTREALALARRTGDRGIYGRARDRPGRLLWIRARIGFDLDSGRHVLAGSG